MADNQKVNLEVGGRMPFRYSLGQLYTQFNTLIQKQQSRQLQFKVTEDNILYWKWSDETSWKEVAELSEVSPAPATSIAGVTGLQEALDSKRDDGVITITDIEGLDAALKKLGLWDEITGKPDTFPPEAHTHEIDDVNGLRKELDGKVNDGEVSIESVNGLPARLDSLEYPQWSEIEGKPETFPPESHKHAIADVTGLQTALDGKRDTGKIPTSDVTGLDDQLAKIGGAPAWSSVTGKPTTFPPSAHQHEIADVNGLKTILDAIPKAEVIESKVVTAGQKVAVKFAKTYPNPPAVIPNSIWSGQQEVIGQASEITTTGCNVTVMQSTGTLLLNTSQFASAPAGTTFRMLVIQI